MISYLLVLTLRRSKVSSVSFKLSRGGLTLSFIWCSFYRLCPGGILTIADDMLKNDGTKFLEMMEQLAIRRSVREEQNLRDMQEETDEEEEEEDDDESRE